MKYLLYILFCCLPVVGWGQTNIISTFAGTGTANYSGDGGLATVADIGWVHDVAVDHIGNVYISIGTQNRVRKIDTNGIITTYAGTGVSGYNGDNIPANTAQLSWPTGMKVDAVGNLYISDVYNNRIRKVDAVTGIITTIVGNGADTFGGDGGLAINASIDGPQRMAFDSHGNFYFIDNGIYRLRKVDTAGIITTVMGDGTAAFAGDGGLAINAQFQNAYDICIDTADNIYIADWGCRRIRKIDAMTGIINTIAGNGTNVYNGDSIPALSASMDPFGIYIDKANNLFIADYHNSRIRKVVNDTIYTVVGLGSYGFSGDNALAINAELDRPHNIDFDKCGDLYIVDYNNKRVRRVDMAAACSDNNTAVQSVTIPLTFTVSPNPATSQITITSNTKVKAINIFNTLGQIVVRIAESGSEKITLDISTLPTGIYYLKLTDEHNATRTEKIIKSPCDYCNPELQLLMEQPE